MYHRIGRGSSDYIIKQYDDTLGRFNRKFIKTIYYYLLVALLSPLFALYPEKQHSEDFLPKPLKHKKKSFKSYLLNGLRIFGGAKSKHPTI